MHALYGITSFSCKYMLINTVISLAGETRTSVFCKGKSLCIFTVDILFVMIFFKKCEFLQILEAAPLFTVLLWPCYMYMYYVC